MNGIELAYLGVEVTDVQGLEAILSGIVGLVRGEAVSGASSWRDDSKVHRVLVTEGPANDATVFGFELPSLEQLDATVTRLEELGYECRQGSAEERADRKVDALYATTAPWGTPVELVHGLRDAEAPFESPLMPGGFKTEGVGFGHAVVLTLGVEEAHEFVTSGLGLAQTDSLELKEFMPGVTVRGRFYHGNPRHHTLAVVGAPDERNLHHFMVETVNRDNVGEAFDRTYNAGVPIANGIGRHDNDQMFSFYLETPAGFQIEVGYGGLLVGPDWDGDRVYDRISAWGHQPVVRS